MADYQFNKPEPLSLKRNLDVKFKKFKRSVEIYFKTTKTTAEDDEVQVARLLNLLGDEALELYASFNIENETYKKIMRQRLLDMRVRIANLAGSVCPKSTALSGQHQELTEDRHKAVGILIQNFSSAQELPTS